MMKMRKNGFSLIELMVAITISMVAMVAVSEMYVSTRQTYRLQSMQVPLTDEGRFAMSMIQRVVSQTGFRRSPATIMATDRIAIAANVITLKFDPDGINQISCDGSVPLAGVAQTLVIQKNGNKLQCGVIDWVAPATAGTGNSSEVVGFAVTFGIDTGPSTTTNFGCGPEAAGNKPGDCIADSYVSALPGLAYQQIVAVKACLILRSEATDSSVVKSAAVKDCAGTDIGGSQTDHKLYRAFRTTVLLKNR
jgi:type IV pilus assembly protein PilW